MRVQGSEAWPVIQATVGKFITNIKQPMYVYQNEIEDANTPLQLTFSDNSILLLEGGGDGESLSVDTNAWVDDFAEPLSEENREFVRTHGKWTMFDVSEKTLFDKLINAKIYELYPIFVGDKKLCGVQMFIGDQVLSVVNEFDEIHLFWGKDNPELLARNYLKIENKFELKALAQ